MAEGGVDSVTNVSNAIYSLHKTRHNTDTNLSPLCLLVTRLQSLTYIPQCLCNVNQLVNGGCWYIIVA